MKMSGIGGQAVLEGIMMKNGDNYAVAVRKPDKEIEVEVKEYHGVGRKNGIRSLPFIRGVFNFADLLVLGMQTLMWSASFFEEEEEPAAEKKKTASERTVKKETAASESDEDILALPEDVGTEAGSPHGTEKKGSAAETAMMGGTVILSVVLAIAIFMVLPMFAARFFERFIGNKLVISLIEGVIRLAVFLLYVWAISFMEDIRRTFMYHGAEHKCINCVEHGLPLTVDNVRNSSREHKRCGTSFLLFVMLISILVFIFLQFDNVLLRFLSRIVFVPVIAGISYEVLRLAGRTDNALINLISKPGLLLQKLTTREPDDDMIEVAITAVEKVFDWKTWEAENF